MGRRTSVPPKEVDMVQVRELLFATAVEGLVVLDAQDRIIMSNPRLNLMFGYEQDELQGNRIAVLLPGTGTQDDKHSARGGGSILRRLKSGLLQGRRKDGGIFPVELTMHSFKAGAAQYVMALVTDITLRRNAEEELKRTHQELREVERQTSELLDAEFGMRQALEKERELNALKGRFVSMASHEFRTPLSTIMTSLDLIARYADGRNAEKLEKHIMRIRTKVREMTAMLNEFLSLERIEMGQMVSVPVPLDIVHLSIELIEDLRPLARPGQEIDYDHRGNERDVTLDRQMLGNIVANLLTNAMKYSADEQRIQLRSKITDGRLIITVRDHGIGIPAEEQGHLFERFFRARNALTVQGTGLGLNILKRYVDLLGGRVSFKSEPGNTVFTVKLPQHITVPQEPVPPISILAAHENHTADRGRH